MMRIVNKVFKYVKQALGLDRYAMPGLVITVAVCLLNLSLHAQTNSILFSPSKTEINAANEELVDITLKIKNATSRTVNATVKINPEKDIELISKDQIPVFLGAGDSIFVPVKIFVGKKARSGKNYPVNFLLKDDKSILLAQTGTSLKIIIKRNVNLFALVSNILLDDNTDSIKIPVRVSNPGNTMQRVTVVCRFPGMVQSTAFHETIQLTMQPLSDTLMYFTKPVNRKMINSEGFDANITGLYANGDVFGMAYIRIQSARSNRHYRDLSISDTYNENTITLSSQSMFSPTQSYLLVGRGNLELPNGNIGYNLDITTWKAGYSPAMVRNTWLGFETHNVGIKAGNLNRNLDINLSGRGASVFVNDTARSNRYEAGYIDGNTNLLGNRFNLFPTGEAAWGAFTHTHKRWELNSFAVYESNPAMNAKNLILGNDFSYMTPKSLRFTGNLSAGYTSEFVNTGNYKLGMAASAGVTGIIKNVSISSQNYFSTGYYPGIRRGARSFSERITWLRPASNIWVNMDYYMYKPKNLSFNQFFLPEFSTLRAETGISGKVFKELTLSVAPGFVRETNNSYQFAGTAQRVHFMNAWNVTTALNYPIASNQYLSINTESGIYHSSFDMKNRFHLRSNANYKKGIFNLNAMLQLGTFFMGEAANNFMRQINSTHIINIIPTIQKSFYRNKLRSEAGIAYMNTSYSGHNWYITGRAEYDVLAKTSFYTAINHNRYAGYHLSILEMGLTQKLQLPKVGAKRNSLDLFVYKDLNQNGTYDVTDSAANGYLLYINDIVFITSSDGSIQYKNLPDGDYRLAMPISKGWYAPEQLIPLNKKLRIEIPLQRTGTLKGTVAYKSNEFSYEIARNLSGITIIATDDKNHSYRTKTNTEGQYIFYIPVGNYSISIAPENLPAEVEPIENGRQVKVENGVINTISHELKIKDRKIETKKFISPSLKNKK